MQHRELRLALICYGGVSLAVYMHGITREVWSLVRASRDREAGDAPATPLAAAYRGLLDELDARADLRLRVVNDIVAGASAGGLNGVFLARALTTGQSLEPLTRLWLDSADVETLLSEDARPASRFTKAWAEPIAWMLARRGAVEEGASDEAKAEVAAKLSRLVRARWFSPPFGGEVLANLILDALGAMAAVPVGPPLLPPGQPLDLFVTATDFHGRPQRLPLHSPPFVDEREHRLVFGFRGVAGGSLGSDAALTLAGRATASFPGAFPPATVAEIDRVLAGRGEEWPARDADLRQLLPRRHADGTAEDAVMIDGSVLTNAPFGSALAALRSRPAKRPVDRRFVYIDPAPGHGAGGGVDGESPGFFGTVFGALSTIPRQQPIRDDLEAIGARTARVERVGRIVDALEPAVSAQVDEAIGRPFFFDRPTGDRLIKWSRAVSARVGAKAGVALTGYRELRLSQLSEDVAGTLGPGTPGAGVGDPAAVAALVGRLWTHFHAGADGGVGALDRLDAAFRSRRLRRFARTVAAVAGSGEVDAELLEPVRAATFDALNRLQAGAEAVRGCGLLADLLASEAEVGRLVDRWVQLRDLPAFDRATADALAAALAPLPDEPRRRLLRDWLGFPAVDLATLPLTGGERLDEFDSIKVDRIAPQDATTLRGPDQTTLRGVEFNHFGAFFSRRYRENDYLWGRLHGAERMVDLVLSTLPPADRPSAEWTVVAKARLFAAVLDEERERLTLIPELIAELGKEVARLAKAHAPG